MRAARPLALVAAALVAGASVAWWPASPTVDPPPRVLAEVVTHEVTTTVPPAGTTTTAPPAFTMAAATTRLPAPSSVSATAGPGSVTVTFSAVRKATSYMLRVSGGPVPATTTGGTATGPSSPLTVTGLASGTPYTATVVASNDAGAGTPSAPTAQVVPSGPVTNTAALAPGRTFVNQSTSFVSSAGTNSSRRPQATEKTTTSLFSPPVTGLPAGVEWRLLWLRAHNCEDGPRRVEFFVVDESVPATVRKFTQADQWLAGQPNRDVSAEVPAGGQLSWTATEPVVVGPGQSVGARWYDMAGGATACNWQFAAVQQPAGTGAEALPAGEGPLTGLLPARTGAGMRTVWATVPAGATWAPSTVAARNCETGPRQMEVMLLGPGAVTMGSPTTAADGAGPVTVAPGDTFRWSPGSALVLPAGWSVGVRWLGMTGDRLADCTWEAVA